MRGMPTKAAPLSATLLAHTWQVSPLVLLRAPAPVLDALLVRVRVDYPHDDPQGVEQREHVQVYQRISAGRVEVHASFVRSFQRTGPEDYETRGWWSNEDRIWLDDQSVRSRALDELLDKHASVEWLAEDADRRVYGHA
jgi:hypothetical protein